MCEQYTWDKGTVSSLVFDVLTIDKFTDLDIAPAHRYIAYLAREGLVHEVITTNYDTCIERAYAESLGHGHDRVAFSISSLAQYREYGGRTEIDGSIPYLKVYHINGCAETLNQGGADRENIAASIILTERQLQDWGNRQWVKDLLRDRLRSKNIVFSGFGSQEPQVRHTVLQILEEFELNSGESAGNKDPWNAPNAVYVHAFKTPTFAQRQILMAYVKTHGNGRRADPSAVERSGNCFSNQDMVAFFPSLKGDKLPADAFWQALFKAVFWRLLKSNWLSHGSPFFYLLEGRVRCLDILFEKVNRWILPAGSSNLREQLYGRLETLLDFEEGERNARGLVLSKVIWGIRHRGQRFQSGWYASPKDKGVIISAYFVLRYIFEILKGPMKWNVEAVSNALGSGFSVTGSSRRGPACLLLMTHSDTSFVPNEIVECDLPNQRTIIQVLIGSVARSSRCRIRITRPHPGSHFKSQFMVDVIQLSLVDLLSWRKGTSRTYHEVLESVQTAILHPRILLDERRARIKSRARPVRGE